MKNLFKTSKRSIAAILTLCILLGIAGTCVYAASTMPEEYTVVTEETTQELVLVTARACSNGRPGSPVKCTGSWLSNNGIDDPESYKSDYVNDGSLFDIYRDTSNNNALWLGNKSGTIWIPCF